MIDLSNMVHGSKILSFAIVIFGIVVIWKIFIQPMFDDEEYEESELHKARSIGMESEYKQANKKIKINNSRGIISYLKGR